MSYAMHGLGFDGLGTDVPVTDPITGGELIEHPEVDAPACGSALAVQQMLKDLGYYKEPIDGTFTIATFASLQHFCLDVGIPYRVGTYPQAAQCGALLGAWQNKRDSKGPFPRPGYPVVMPGITPANRMAGVLAAAAAAARCATKDEKPPISVSGFWGLQGILGSIAFGGFGAFDPASMPTIGKGRTNDKAAVITWQSFLIGQGMGAQVGTADGVFGTNTHNATVAWQNANGVSPGDGIVGKNTWTKAAAKLTVSIPPVTGGGVTVPIPGGGGVTIPVPAGGSSTVPVPVPTPGTPTTTTGTSPTPSDPGSVPPPPQNPVERAQAWWANQPKQTQYAVMGGSAVVLVGLLAVVASSGKKRPQMAQPNGRRHRRARHKAAGHMGRRHAIGRRRSR